MIRLIQSPCRAKSKVLFNGSSGIVCTNPHNRLRQNGCFLWYRCLYTNKVNRPNSEPRLDSSCFPPTDGIVSPAEPSPVGKLSQTATKSDGREFRKRTWTSLFPDVTIKRHFSLIALGVATDFCFKAGRPLSVKVIFLRQAAKTISDPFLLRSILLRPSRCPPPHD